MRPRNVTAANANPAPPPLLARDSYASTAFGEIIDRSEHAATARFTASL